MVSRFYVVVGFGRDGFNVVGVLDDQVSIGFYSNAVFSGVKVEDFGCIGVGYGYKLVFVYFFSDLRV